MKEIHGLFVGCEFAEPMVISLETITPRFITRFNVIAMEIGKIITGEDSPPPGMSCSPFGHQIQQS